MERSISGPFDGTAQNINSLDGSSHSYESLTIAEDLKMQADVDDFVKSLVQEQFDVPAQEDATCNPSSARTSFFPTLDQFLVPFLEGEGNSNNWDRDLSSLNGIDVIGGEEKMVYKKERN